MQEKRKLKTSQQVDTHQDSVNSNKAETGLVISRYGKHLAVLPEDPANSDIYHCQVRQNLGHIACGDHVIWEKTHEDPNVFEGVVTAVEKRSTVLSRSTFSGEEKPLAANIDQLIIVIAPQPEPSEYLIDQYLIAAERAKINAIIAVNKSDLLNEDNKQALTSRLTPYQEIGYPVVFISSKTTNDLEPLTNLLKSKTSILVGQSGVGKSSLTNALIPDLDLQTQKLSDKNAQGQHTTSASTLYFLENDARIIDSPGVRSFRLGQIDQHSLETGYRDLRAFLGHCKFSNCSHTSEPGCALIQALEEGKISSKRLENFLHMLNDLKST